MKKIKLDKDLCIFCGQCQAIAPLVFSLEDEIKTLLETIPEELEESVQEAIDACPTNVISWEE